MLNAIQQRMVEESLVEKEVYEAMLSLRASIAEHVGSTAEPESESEPEPSTQGPPRLTRRGRLKPSPATPPLGEPPPPDAPGGGVPADIAAVGNPERDPSRRVKPFVPATQEGDGTNPFPMLGSQGRPLG